MLEYVRTWGDSESPTVLLLHPAGGTRHNWTPHAEALRDDYHVVAVDLPAHGIHPDDEFSFDRAVEDVGEVLEDTGPAVLVGHSQGGYVSMQAAAAHADRVDGLLLAGADYNWRKPKMLALTAVYYPLTYVFEAISYSDRLSELVLERFGEGNDPRQQPPDGEETHDSLQGNATSFRADILQRMWPHAEAYDGPTLIAHGGEEPLQDHAERLAERADAKLVWYDGGHQAPMDDTDEFAEIVREFLDGVYPERETTATQP